MKISSMKARKSELRVAKEIWEIKIVSILFHS